MSMDRKIERRKAKPLREKHRTHTSNKSGRSRLIGAMSKGGLEEFTKLKVVGHKR